MRIDLPFIEPLYKSIIDKIDRSEVVTRVSRSDIGFSNYITMIKSLPQYSQLRWRDSQFEDENERIDLLPTKEIRKGIIKIFGDGYTQSQYSFLQDQYDSWKSRTSIETKSQELYVSQICSLQLQIHEDTKAGRDISKKLDTLNKLMDAAKLQPKQNVGNASTDDLTFGQLIEKWEKEKPIPEPSEEFKDVDRIGHYIRVWFAGHICRVFGFKNSYSKEYNDEISKYTVTKPQAQVEEANSDEIYS